MYQNIIRYFYIRSRKAKYLIKQESKFVNTNTLVFLQKMWYSYNIKINFIINTIM